MGHAGLPFDSCLPPRHHAHPANARMFLLVDWYEYLHPVVASALPEVSSTKNLAADGPLAYHLDVPARRARHYRQPASITSAPSRSHLELTPTFCSSPIVSVAEPTCSQSLQPSLQLRARQTLSSTGIFPSGDARAAYSRTTASRFAQSFRMLSTSFLVFVKLPPAPTTQVEVEEGRVRITRWPKCWQW